MGFHHVGQAGLEPLTSGDLPALASQSTGIGRCARPIQIFNIITFMGQNKNKLIIDFDF